MLGLCVLSARAAPPPVILIVGDSLSTGYGIAVERAWPVLLQRRLESLRYPHRVVNASISGETTAGGLARLPALLTTHAPSTVVIELGANDGLRGLSVEEVADNLQRMVDLASGAGAATVVVRMELPPNYGSAYAKRFAAVYDGLGAPGGAVAIAPFFLREIALDPGLMQPDGLHPTAAAQPRMLDAVWPTIESSLKRLDART